MFSRKYTVGLISALIALVFSNVAGAQNLGQRIETNADKTRMNASTVSIISGKSDSAYLAVVEDMATVLDKRFELRIIAMLGKGALQNVEDILYLKGTDMGITQANVLAYLKRTGELGANIENRLRYITKLFNEEVHIIAGSSTPDLRGLQGQKVNFGEPGSGTQLTAQLVFEALGITVTPVYMSQSDALVAIRRGEIAGTVMVAGKPSPLLGIFRVDGDLKLLPIPYEEALEEDYLPTTFTHDDYPSLVQEGEIIETVAVPAVLASFNWAPNSDRYRRVANFVEAFFSKFEEFRKEARHPKWREVNLAAKVPGWERIKVAEDWLRENSSRLNVARRTPAPAANNVDQQRATFLEFLAAQNGGGGNASAGMTPQQEQLFRMFMQWMQQNQPQRATAPAAAPQAAPAAPPRGSPAAAPPAQSGGNTVIW